jgi:TolB-like protein/DNA-binding winged helix-turn-helix (wHTH) protein
MDNDRHRADPSSSAPARFRILDLEVDVGRQTVTRDGAELHVPKLSFDLLVTLARAAPNVVSVAELMERVWSRQVVGIETVAQRVKLLRQVLGDDAEHPRYLSGERRRGYRIIAPVIRLTPEILATGVPGVPLPQPASPVPAAPEIPAPVRGRRRAVALLYGTTAVILFAALIDLIARGTHSDVQGNATPMSAAAPYSVAVLPFRSISGHRDDELLGLGISELVINRLTGEHELRVIAPDSALRPRREAESAAESGRRLGAHYVVDGSVQREGSQVRITADLIDVPAGRHVGALLVERSTAELFRLQDDIAERVSYLLLGKTHPEEPPVQAFGAEATLAYLRGRALLATRKVADADAAAQEFTRAIALAPAFAAAYAGRAEARFQRLFVVNALNGNAGRMFEEMQPDIERALQLDPGNGPAIFIRAKYREMKGDEAGAFSDFRRAPARRGAVHSRRCHRR